MPVILGQPLVQVPWHPVLGLYFVLIGIVSGVTLVGAWLRPEAREPRWTLDWYSSRLSLATLAVCCLVLAFDLGRPERFWLMLTAFGNLGSAMSVGAKLLAVKGLLLVLFVRRLDRERRLGGAAHEHRVRDPLAGSLTLISVALAVYPAVLLARTWIAPLSASPIAGMLFFTTSLLLGLTALVPVVDRVPALVADAPLHARLSAGATFLGWSNLLLIGMLVLSLHGAGPVARMALDHLVSGASGVAFWTLVMALGLLLPLGLLLKWPLARVPGLVSAGALAVGAATLRLLFFAVR